MSAPTRRPLEGLTILVVDDHVDSVEMLQEYLGSMGAYASAATSAKRALAIAEALQLDVVLVDLNMPREDGRWFLREFRTSQALGAPTVPIFAVSGERHDGLGPESGFEGFFLKPVDLDVLVAALQPFIRRRSR